MRLLDACYNTASDFREDAPTLVVKDQTSSRRRFLVIFIRDKDSLIIKIKLLDENRHKVMAKQLLLLHNGVSSYFAGNQQALEGSIQQFNIQQKKSFLEQ